MVGLTTNISTSLTNDFHYSYLRNFWQWKGANAPAQVAGAAGAIEPLGESSTIVMAPYNVNAQNIRTRIWNGKDNYFTDNLTKLKGDHLIQFGGQYQHNWNYHQRTDNGASINFTPTYQIGGDATGGNITYNTVTGIGKVGKHGELSPLSRYLLWLCNSNAGSQYLRQLGRHPLSESTANSNRRPHNDSLLQPLRHRHMARQTQPHP